jgi:MFS family permease
LGRRLLPGLLADRFSTKQVLIAVCGRWRSRFGAFYALAVIFGRAYGGVMPLYAVLVREYFGQQVMGTAFGAATLLSIVGIAFGPLAAGWIFDTLDAYSWLFVGTGISAITPRTAATGLSGQDRPN